MRSLLLVAMLATAGCGQAAGPARNDPQEVRRTVSNPPPPAGARVEPSGYWTILSAPDSPDPPPRKPLAIGKRSAEPAGRNNGRMTQQALLAATKPWVDRLNAERLVTGYGVNAREGRLDMDMVVSEAEYRALAVAKGWGPAPPTIFMRFSAAPAGPAIAPDALPGIRIFPQNDRNLGITHQAAIHGSIVLRDGCFFVESGSPESSRMLAYFPREVGLYRDPQGYLALRSRFPDHRQHVGRIGESFVWAGPIAASEQLPMVRDLRARCGNAPLMMLSVPTSQSIFLARYPHLRNPMPPPPPPSKLQRGRASADRT